MVRKSETDFYKEAWKEIFQIREDFNNYKIKTRDEREDMEIAVYQKVQAKLAQEKEQESEKKNMPYRYAMVKGSEIASDFKMEDEIREMISLMSQKFAVGHYDKKTYSDGINDSLQLVANYLENFNKIENCCDVDKFNKLVELAVEDSFNAGDYEAGEYDYLNYYHGFVTGCAYSALVLNQNTLADNLFKEIKENIENEAQLRAPLEEDMEDR